MVNRSEPSTAELPEETPVRKKRRKKTPLWDRILTDERMVALVRLFGHDGMPLNDVPQTAKPLLERFGKENLQEAADEIIEIVGDGDDAVARLTEEAQRLAIQLLGRPRAGNSQRSDNDQPANSHASSEAASKPDRPTTPIDTVATPAESEPSPAIDSSSSESICEDESPSEPSAASACEATPTENHDWANYETARVAAFLNGDREFLDECLHLVEFCRGQTVNDEPERTDGQSSTEHPTSRLADQFQRLVCEYNPLKEEDTVFANLLDAALSNVDWRDLAESFLKRRIESPEDE